MAKNALIAYFFFILGVEFVVVYLTLNLLPSKTPYLAASIIVLVMLLSSFWIVKTLLSPLYTLSKRFDTLIKETLHELNIPIATIKANSTMLKKELQNEKSLRQLERIEESAQMLHYLHRELEHTLNKEFHGASKSSQSIERLIEKRLDHYKTIFSQVSFTLIVKEPLEHTLDPFGFQKAIDNLVANSVKHHAKHITFEIAHNTLSIEDDGEGISKEHLVHIFERYYQENPENEGKGIGLAIVKAYCDQEKIRLNISSEVGRFTKVMLHF